MGEIADYLLDKKLKNLAPVSRKRVYRDDVIHIIVTKTLKDTTITKAESIELMKDWFNAESTTFWSQGWKYPKDKNNLRQVIQFTLDYQDHFKDYLRRLDK